MMARVMKWATMVFFGLTVAFTAFIFTNSIWALPCAITFGTCFYHFAMRLWIGCLVEHVMHNTADYEKPWYQLHSFETRLYRLLKVKKWKGRMPTYDPSCFDPNLHSWERILQAMCQAEIVHEVIVVFSFLPLLAAIPFGAFGVFLITSLLAALYDLCFVIMQRFNRPRIIKLLKKERA